MKEKIKRISSSTWALLLALMMVVSSFSVLAATTNVEKTGETKTTVYFVPASQNDFSDYLNSSKTDIDSRYTVKLNLHYGSYENDPWGYVDVTKSSDTFGGNSVYFSEFTDKHDGLAEMQIQIYDGETQKKLVKPITTWTEPSVYNGKVYDSGSWKNYTPDTTKVADSVSLSSNATDGKITQGNDLILTAKATGKVAGDVKYTFYQDGTKIDEKTTSSESVETTVPNLSSGTYKYTVTVSKDNCSDVSSSEVSVTVKSNKWYIYGGLNKSDWNNKAGISMSWSTTENAYVSDVTFDKADYFRLYDGSTEYGPNRDAEHQNVTISTGKTDNQIYSKKTASAFIVPSGVTSNYYICTDGTYLWYKVAQPNVATSVALSPDSATKNTGESVTLTATANTPVSGELTYTFTETTSGATTTPQEIKSSNGTAQATFTDLSEGEHKYKVEVSANGYTSVTATVQVNVNQTYNITAKYEITENGVSYEVKDSNVNIVSVDGKVTSNTSSGKVFAKNTITIGSSTYVFAGWESNNGSFTDETNASTTFSPTSNGDVIAQYKKQYTVSASTTGGNGTINVGNTTYLAGDTVTINIVPYTSYQLASLKRTTGTSGETTDVKAGVSNNKYVVPKISSNETFVATFEKIPLDYSKYRLCGKFDNNQWSFNKGCKFDTNGKATFTIAQPASGDNGQFRIDWSDGSTTIKYGCGQQTEVQTVEDGVPYTPVKNSDKPYRVPSEGTYVVEIVDIVNGVPKFKVTKDNTISNYQLYISEGRNAVGTLLGNFTKGSDDGKIVTKLITVDNGIYFFHVKKGNVNYCSGAEGTLGSSIEFHKYDNGIEGVKYELHAGSYKVTYSNIDTEGKGYFKIESIANPLAKSVTLSSSATAVKTGNYVTLTAQINETHVEDINAEYTYTFYEGKNNRLGEIKTKKLTASWKTTSDKEGKVSYHVVVSTNATYTDPDYSTVNPTYTEVSSETIQVDYRDKILYIAEVTDGKLGELRPLNEDSFNPANGAKSVTIAVFLGETISDETVCNLTVSESKNKYTTITSSTINTDDVAGIPTYTIKCNEGASSPTIYIVDGNIYAVATFDMGATNTFDNTTNTKTVDYYFAEPTDNTGISNPDSGDGLRIYYWNNSVEGKNGYADVTTKVDKDGKASGSNKITVNMDDLYSSGVTDSKTFNVYKVSLPVWATSFRFVSSGDTKIPTFSTFVPKTAGDASIGLNPNRIYLLYQKDSSYYSRGVVLDSSFWTKTSRKNNDVPTKNFKANAVNYNTQYNGGSVSYDFNTYLNNLYDKAYANPLFFGYVDPTTTEVAGNKNFRIQDNLAMRCDAHAYYASVQGLAGNTLSSTSKNENGCGYLLTADGSSNMPLFDYKKLMSNPDVASNVYEGLNFPFNESTFNGITTYSYDSFTDKNRVIDGGDFKVDTYSNATVGDDKGVGFFPFDKTTPTNNANKYGFGTEFDIDFYMSETGTLTDADGKGKDITFNFSGDDDVWVYVDGVLVLDLGGAHKVSSGSINFSDMKVIYKAAVDTSDNISAGGKGTADTFATNVNYVKTFDLAKIFKANGAEFNNKNSSKKHTLQMFYMERGSFDSNCSVSFNLPQNTGLLVRNDVNFDSVNPGLKDATMGIANKDYFSYMIENKYASDDEFAKLTSKYGTLPNKTTSDNIGNFTFDRSNPLYPIETKDNIIRRVVNGTTYYLAVKDKIGKECDSYWTTQHLKDAYTGLPSINFSLPDDFAKLENSTDENNSTAVSGQTDTNGGFNLLFNQSAKFNSKIPSNTMVKVVQNETLYEVNAGDSKTAMSVASDDKGKVTRRNVSNFYSTSYKITDDKSQKVITEAKGNKNSNVFSNDTKAGTDGFYFADYSENHSDSSAMTVNFTNTVSTSDIKIRKNVTTDSSENRVASKSSGDRFTFTVKLSNIFGDKDDKTLNEYKNLTYKVYDSKGNLEGTRTYGESGVSITANEYAVITGIPVGTHYEVTEKQRTGYQFVSVNGEFVGTTSNSTKAVAQTNEINDTDFIPCNDSVDSKIIPDATDAKTVKGNMPIANDPNNAGKTVQLTYTNKEAGLTITFKYYDRDVTTGEVAHINKTPTVVNYVFSVDDLNTKYKNSDDTYNYAKMITDAVAAGGIDPDNVIDSYKFFTSQAEAVGDSGIKSLTSYRNKVNSKYLTYGEAYSSGFAKHTDCYGRLQGSAGAAVSDDEDWVSYYNGKTKYATEDDAKAANTPVTSITVWFFNNLRTYKPTFMYATQSSELNPIADNKFVGNHLNDSINTFYNVRLGVANGVDSIDEQGIYLKEYGVTTGYTGTYSGTAMSIQKDGKELKFLYWSYDANGKSIASNSYKYGYRITNNIKLYAIYGKAKDKTAPGLTVSMNNPDYHTDSNGINRVRLNTVMNVYNCPDDDPNIKNVAVIYILDPNNFIQKYIEKENTTALKNIRDKVYDLIKANGSQDQFSGVKIKIDGTNDNKALGLTYTASPELLTNKNRVQFTTDFKQSALVAQKIIYTFSAMNYESATEKDKTDWIVSDNCIKYMYDEEKGKFTGDLIQVNGLQ